MKVGTKHKSSKKKLDHDVVPDSSIWSKFPTITKVHIVSNNIFTIAQCTTEDGVTEYYDWGKKSNRELIRKTVAPDAEIIVNPDVVRGWDYD